MTRSKCDECQGAIIESRGTNVCVVCGLVYGQTIVSSSFSNSLDSTRVGTQSTYPSNITSPIPSLGSHISYYNQYNLKDSTGRDLDSEKQIQFRKFKKVYTPWGTYSGNETHKRTLRIFSEVCFKLGVRREIQDVAIFQYKKLSDEFGKKITNHVLLVALCLVIAVRRMGHKAPFSLSEIVKAFKENGNRVSGKTLLRLAQKLGITFQATLSRKSEDYIFRITSLICNDSTIQRKLAKLRISPEKYEALLQRSALTCLGYLGNDARGGRRPYTFATSLLYCIDHEIASLHTYKPILSQASAAKVSNVAEYTIRDHVHYIKSSGIFDIIKKITPSMLSESIYLSPSTT